MKIYTAFLSVLLFASCASGKEINYTASTPAGAVVRSFMNLPLTDSIDFIRWKLVLQGEHFDLSCNYGISKPNTNGFIKEGKTVKISGELSKKEGYYRLTNGTKELRLIELNTGLLHILDESNNLLTGNGGWSYTLNNTTGLPADPLNIPAAEDNIVRDSVIYVGRTPCKIPGILPANNNCYKIKWKLVLYPAAGKNDMGSYRIDGNLWYREKAKRGTWSISLQQNGHSLYTLKDEKENALVYLLKTGNGILLFTDKEGKLLVGDEDFSYTLNRL